MKLLGITGPSGAGKSTVMRHLEERGIPCISSDEVYHELLRTDDTMLQQMQIRFPTVFREGELDRKALGAVVFSNAAAKVDLEEITHPVVLKAIRKRLDAYTIDGEELVAIEAILLLESSLVDLCDTVLAVVARPEILATRITNRDNISLHYAFLRLQAQRSEAFFRSRADYLLQNNGTTQELLDQVDTLLESLMA